MNSIKQSSGGSSGSATLGNRQLVYDAHDDLGAGSRTEKGRTRMRAQRPNPGHSQLERNCLKAESRLSGPAAQLLNVQYEGGFLPFRFKAQPDDDLARLSSWNSPES